MSILQVNSIPVYIKLMAKARDYLEGKRAQTDLFEEKPKEETLQVE